MMDYHFTIGKRQKNMNKLQLKRKKQSMAGVLWLFMLHRFYLGKHFTAIVQIFTGGGLLVWWFIDGYKIFTGTITDKNGVEVD
jgi:TM2 domain-containing membrane protein YozV